MVACLYGGRSISEGIYRYEGALDFTKLGDDACYAIKDYMDIMPICMDDDGPWTDDELAKVLDFWNCVTAIQPKLSLGCLFPGLQESSG